ncbi:hypothetical protein Y600_6012 [Burkholderia pseudomallei MSHR3709]|nr:hypothetical protein Y600_6012 [Burkholderia pseudomallei MSHR3709]
MLCNVQPLPLRANLRKNETLCQCSRRPPTYYGVRVMNSSSSHRLALADVLLRDAQIGELSEATRIACAFEAGIRYLQKATAPLLQSPGLESLKEAALSSGLQRLQCSGGDRRLGRELLRWFEHRYELPPLPCSADDALAWAIRIRQASRSH